MLQQGNRPDPLKYGAVFFSNAALSVGSSVTVFSAASNTRGAVLHRATLSGGLTGSDPKASLIAHTAAPTAETQGECISVMNFPATNAGLLGACNIETDVFIPAGKGLYFFAVNGETASRKNALYTLL